MIKSFFFYAIIRVQSFPLVGVLNGSDLALVQVKLDANLQATFCFDIVTYGGFYIEFLL